jgi:predicted O-methyltransferase YrrM
MLQFKDLEELVSKSISSTIESEYLRDLFNLDTSSVYYKYLYNVLNKFKGEEIVTLELGTFKGRSSAFLAEANPEGSVLTVDLAPKEESKEVLERYPNLKSFLGRSDTTELVNSFEDESIDICYFDTEHEYDVVSKEVEVWHPKIKKGGIMLFDDVHMNKGMEKFWKELPYEKGYSDELHWTGFGYAIK